MIKFIYLCKCLKLIDSLTYKNVNDNFTHKEPIIYLTGISSQILNYV